MSYNYSSSTFIGETSHGRSMPVFFDPHSCVINNKPPGCLITGGPGSGKTHLALTLTTISAILGKTTVVIDPKGDFLPLINLKDELGEFQIWNLAQGRAGMLDPFYMAKDPADTLTLVVEVIDLFVGGLEKSEQTVLSPIIKDVMASQTPSLQKVVDELRGSEKEIARNLGTQLDMLRSMRFAKLCFAPGTGKRQSVSVDKGLTVIAMQTLELPKGQVAVTRQEKLASGILFLLTDFLRRVMEQDDSKNPKTIVIDEAHAILSSPVGARTIASLARLGRSKFLALILITQNNSDLKRLDIENTISTRFAFSSGMSESESIIADMNLPLGEGFEDIIVNLTTGECLMKDFLNRYSTLRIVSWRPHWHEAFNSNPLERQKRLAREKKAAEEAAKAAKAGTTR